MKSAFYCVKCGRMLTAYGEHHNGIYHVVCTCGHMNQIHRELKAGEKLPPKEKLGTGVQKPMKSKGFPHVCKKCKFGRCEITQIGASYSDESDIMLYKCKKCGFVERQADGTGNK